MIDQLLGALKKYIPSTGGLTDVQSQLAKETSRIAVKQLLFSLPSFLWTAGANLIPGGGHFGGWGEFGGTYTSNFEPAISQVQGDLYWGPIPLQGITKFDFAESEEDVKYRASYTEFYGHQEGQTFGAACTGISVGSTRLMVNILRMMKLACAARIDKGTAAKQHDLAKYISWTETAAGSDVWFMKTNDPAVVQDSVRVYEIIDDDDSTYKWKVNSVAPVRHTNFPLITPDTTFSNIYIQTISVNRAPIFYGHDAIEYKIFFRKEVIPRQLIHGIVEEGGHKVGVSFYLSETLSKEAAWASVMLNFAITMPAAITDFVLQYGYRMSIRTVDAMLLSSQGEAEVVNISKVDEVTDEKVVYYRSNNCIKNRTLSYIYGQTVVDLPVNVDHINLTPEDGFTADIVKIKVKGSVIDIDGGGIGSGIWVDVNEKHDCPKVKATTVPNGLKLEYMEVI